MAFFKLIYHFSDVYFSFHFYCPFFLTLHFPPSLLFFVFHTAYLLARSLPCVFPRLWSFSKAMSFIFQRSASTKGCPTTTWKTKALFWGLESLSVRMQPSVHCLDSRHLSLHYFIFWYECSQCRNVENSICFLSWKPSWIPLTEWDINEQFGR